MSIALVSRLQLCCVLLLCGLSWRWLGFLCLCVCPVLPIPCISMRSCFGQFVDPHAHVNTLLVVPFVPFALNLRCCVACNSGTIAHKN